MESKQEYISYKKVLLFGDKGTGKSSLTERFKTNKFSETISPTNEGKIII